MSADAGIATDLDSIRGWLRAQVASYVTRAPEEIDPLVPFAQHGMDSVYLLSLCGDIEAEYGLEVEPTLAWEHPTVAAMADHLRGRLSAG
ncbi:MULTISPECIES: acyl carrier protein [Streptosporangium]|uniref:Acyl carrier protein n=1 Tax=Streptosporangium brasiliense TaxID=47480 RepID=A0ABT9RC04_9ACTN|nr:acyl carrier protein [Streptosporangium brasiliense]MDP9866787.1 acyl carrier protein [Streptosporangium brasiliense]